MHIKQDPPARNGGPNNDTLEISIMEYNMPPCPEAIGTGVKSFIAWQAAIQALAMRCEAQALEGMAVRCDDPDCGDLNVCDSCAVQIVAAGIQLDSMLPQYLNDLTDVAIQAMAEWDPYGLEDLSSLVYRNVMGINMDR
jgi:hypothetical protein